MDHSQSPSPRKTNGFAADFRRFFTRGLAAIMPTLITILLLIKIWEVLWDYLGQHIIYLLRLSLYHSQKLNTPDAVQQVMRALDYNKWYIQLLGVTLAILLVYVVGLFVGNLLGRTMWRLLESGVHRVPLIRAIYPAVKQVTDFLLSEHRPQFAGARVVAIRPHTDNIWSIGLVTGPGIRSLSDSVGSEMVTVFCPNSPAAFSGYVLVVPRDRVIELPLTVEEAMRMLITGGVSGPAQAPDARIPQKLPDKP